MVTKNGTPGPDTLYGTPGNDTLRGKRGNDTLFGEDGNDHLYGGGGDDTLDGGPGDDWLYGNKGADTITGDDGNDRIWGHAGADVLGGGAGDDIIRGGGGADTLFGDGGDNQLYGGKGEDRFALSPDLPGSSVAVDFSYEQGDRILLDVDTNGNGHLDPAERQIYLDLMDRLDFDVQGNETVVTLFAAGGGLTPAAPGDDAPLLRLSEPIQGAMPGLAVYAFGANGEQQVPTNPSRSSDESEASFSPALSGNGRFLAVGSQFDFDGTEPEFSSSVDTFVIDQLTGTPVRVNTGFSDEAGGFSAEIAISGDGRFVAFLNGISEGEQVLVRDLLTGQVRLASDGIPTGDASSLSLAADGRTVAFINGDDAFVSATGDAPTPIPVPGDATSISLSADAERALIGIDDGRLFVADLRASNPVVRFLTAGETPDLSADGRFAVYDNPASDQIIRRDIDGTEAIVVGGRGADPLGAPSVSADGRFVAFVSTLETLVPNDTNNLPDMFVRDLVTGAVARISIDSRGEQAFTGQSFGGGSFDPTISDNGEFIAYTTFSPNLQNAFVRELPEFSFDNGRTVVWSPIDFDRIAAPDGRGDQRTQAELSVGGRFEGNIAAFGDLDSTQVSFQANQLYEITVDADPTEPSNVDFPFLALEPPGESGTIVDLFDGIGTHFATDGGIAFVVFGSNPVIVNNSFGGLDMFLGDYTATLAAIDIPDGPTSPAIMAVGGALQQTLDQAGDRDWYAVQLEAGHVYRFQMRGEDSDGGTLGDPLLKLYDHVGQHILDGLADVDPDVNLDSLLEFTPAADGEYFVSAEAFGGASGSYTLSAIDTSPVPQAVVASALIIEPQAPADEVPPAA